MIAHEGRHTGAVAVVTGGASGMGLATVRRWVAEGGRVVVGDVNESGLKEVAAELGDGVRTTFCDVTDEADQQRLFELALNEFGGVNATVACPASGNCSALVNMPVDEWRQIIDVTLTGVMLTVKHAGRVMSDSGAIVAIASINATMPGVGLSAYNAAKAGVVMLTRIAAMELAPRGIRVNAVAPGLIATAMTMTSGMFDNPDMLADWRANTPLVRHGEAEEVAGLISWLLSPEAAYVTGESIMIDGGTHTMRFPDFPRHMGVSLEVQ